MTPPLLFDLKGQRVFVTGHNGMAGSALVRRLMREDCEILTADRQKLDLTDQSQTEDWLAQNRPDAVFNAAGHVGGIFANDTFPADFIVDNLAIGLNVIRGSFKVGVKKLLALGSSCIYPKLAAQPMREDALLTGPLEPTNEWYAVAKIAAIKMCEAYRKQHGADFISVMPTNLYGPGDNYHPKNSHVPAALIRRFHEGKMAGAPTVDVWGTGKDITIGEFAQIVSDVTGYQGSIVFDTSRPDGPPQKLLDVSRLASLGWQPKIPLREGLAAAYADFLSGSRRTAA